jgi:hypothetical protein
MSLTLALLVLAQALGLCALLINILRAPDAYEDKAGFHIGIKPVGNDAYYDAFSARQPVTPVYINRNPQVAGLILSF